LFMVESTTKFSCFFFFASKWYNRRPMEGLLKKLIQVETTAEKGELAAADIISDELGLAGIDCQIDIWGKNRANLRAHIKSAGGRRGLLFACHLDVVSSSPAGWEYPPFAAVERDGKIYGRGSADMKGGIAAIVTALGQVVSSGTKLQGDITLFAGAGEETDSCGAKRFVLNYVAMPKLAGVVVTEPTDFKIVTAHRGLLWLEVTTRGKAAHGSSPELGVNAITSMRSVLDEMENYEIQFQPHELLGDCSVSVNTIAGGEAINIIPDKCRIGIDIRTLPGQKHQVIISDFEKILAKLKQNNSEFTAEVRVVRDVGALETEVPCAFVRDFCSVIGVSRTSAAGFTTDGPFFAQLAAPVVIFGPGKPQLAHRVDEYIEIADMEKAVEYYKNIISKFLL
jgi:succinyl-diaminopimelate desuccinylase